MMGQSNLLHVVLLGKTGAGKSASGNTILGQTAFVSKKSSKSITNNIVIKDVITNGQRIVVYDTPGFCDPDRPDEEIKQSIQEIFQLTSSGPCVFLLVVKIDRFTAEEKSAITTVEKLLGEQRLKKTWILFTKGDELEGQTINEFINDSEDLKGVMRKYERRYHVFKNKSKNPKQVTSLLKKIFPCLDAEVAKTPRDDSFPETRIVLLGKTGVGKSATGNTILGGKGFKSKDSLSSVTRKTKMKQATVDGRNVSVVDTPGLYDTNLILDELTEEIGTSIYMSSPGPHAFLIVVPLNVRFTDQEESVIKGLEEMFGSGMAKYAFILFTYGDKLPGDIEKEIKKNKALSSVVQQCGGRYHVFNNKTRNRAQVRELLEKIDRMMKENGGACYTNEMFEAAARAKKEEEERLWMEAEKLQMEEKVKLKSKIEQSMQIQIHERQQREMEEKKQRLGEGKNQEEEQEQPQSTPPKAWFQRFWEWIKKGLAYLKDMFRKKKHPEGGVDNERRQDTQRGVDTQRGDDKEIGEDNTASEGEDDSKIEGGEDTASEGEDDSKIEGGEDTESEGEDDSKIEGGEDTESEGEDDSKIERGGDT